MTVDIFIPCLVDQFYPEIGVNMVKVLEKAGVEVHYNAEQTCCGKSAFDNGFWDDAGNIGERFINAFNSENYVVGPSPSCVYFVKNHYEKLFYNSGLHLEFKSLKKRIYDFVPFLTDIVKVVDFEAVLEEKAFLHTCCSSGDYSNTPVQIKSLLKNVSGLDLVIPENYDESCGYQGLGPNQMTQVSDVLLKNFCQKVKDAGSSTIIVDDITCLLNIDTYVKRQKLPINVFHIVDVLATGC